MAGGKGKTKGKVSGKKGEKKTEPMLCRSQHGAKEKGEAGTCTTGQRKKPQKKKSGGGKPGEGGITVRKRVRTAKVLTPRKGRQNPIWEEKRQEKVPRKKPSVANEKKKKKDTKS